MEHAGTLERHQDQSTHSQQPTGSASFTKTCFNGLNALSGIGILSIPYTVAFSGWLNFILLLLVATICCYTGLLLRRCMDSDPVIKTYPDIGYRAFGKKGKAIVSFFIYLELYLVAVEFLILEGDNLNKLFPNTHFQVMGKRVGGKGFFVVLTAVAIMPTMWLRRLGLLAYISASGVFASLLLVGSIFWVGAVDGVGFHERGEIWRWSGVLNAISMFTFCYCGHAVFPTLYTSMTHRRHFPKVLLITFVLCTISYGSMAVQGYLMFGSNLMSQVTLNLPTRSLGSKIAIYTTLIGPITKYAIVVSPIAYVIEDTFPFQNRRSFSILLRTALLMSTMVVALVLPYFGYVMAFTGSFLSISGSILLPCLCYLKIFKAYQHLGPELVLNGVLLVVGLIVAITGTYASLKNIVSHL
ncbi:hypothetical protein NMG60_11036263 [Bertholletia excelsa]